MNPISQRIEEKRNVREIDYNLEKNRYLTADWTRNSSSAKKNYAEPNTRGQIVSVEGPNIKENDIKYSSLQKAGYNYRENKPPLRANSRASFKETEKKGELERLKQLEKEVLSYQKKYFKLDSPMSSYKQIEKPETKRDPYKSSDFYSKSNIKHSVSPLNRCKSPSQDSNLSRSSSTTSCIIPPFGLVNKRFQCYLNTVIQCIISLPDFISAILKTRSSGPTVLSLQGLIRNSRSAKIFSAENITSIFSRIFPTSKQHDAPEFCRILMDKIGTEICSKPQASNSKDPWIAAKSQYAPEIADNVIGLFSSTVQCMSCMNKTFSYEPFNMVILRVMSTLEKSFNDFKSKEVIKKQYKCAKCNAQRDITKNYGFKVLPKYMIIQLKRFEWNPFARKIDSSCAFEEYMEMTDEDGRKFGYSLVAIAVHSGSTDGGHYYAFAKRGGWYCFNDSDVRQVSANIVLNSQAYLLFYSMSS